MTIIPRMGSWFVVPSNSYPMVSNTWPFTIICTLPCGFSSEACAQPSWRRSRIQQLKGLQIAADARQFFDLLGVEGLRHIRAVRLQQRRGGRHLHFLRDITDLHGCIEARRLGLPEP